MRDPAIAPGPLVAGRDPARIRRFVRYCRFSVRRCHQCPLWRRANRDLCIGVPPSEQLGELFRNVQLKSIFPDSKTFADLRFDESPNAILADYQARIQVEEPA